MEFFFCFFLFFFCFFDFFYFFIFFVLVFFCFFVLCGKDYFGGIFFLDSFSFYLVFLSVLVFLFCFYSGFVDGWFSNFFSSYLYFLGGIYLLVFFSFFCFSVFFFYVSFEFIFVLMFFFLLNWGYSPERLQASFYMVFYTIVVSFPFLIGVSYVGVLDGVFCVFFDWGYYWGLFFMVVFFVKLPVYGVHLWLPKAHVEAPVTGSMALAGVLLKLGGYGLFRFFFGLGSFLFFFKGLLVSVGLLGGLFSCYLCLRQSDMKSFVAYSSICHMGFMLGGLVGGGLFGKYGGLFMMVSHGYCSSCLFYILFVFYERFYSRSVLLLKGIGGSVSLVGFFWFFFMAFNMGVPPSFSFFSEIFILSGLVGLSLFNFFWVGLVVFFGGLYGVFLYVICFHGGHSFMGLSFLASVREYLLCYFHGFYLIFCVYLMGFFF